MGADVFQAVHVQRPEAGASVNRGSVRETPQLLWWALQKVGEFNHQHSRNSELLFFSALHLQCLKDSQDEGTPASRCLFPKNSGAASISVSLPT